MEADAKEVVAEVVLSIRTQAIPGHHFVQLDSISKSSPKHGLCSTIDGLATVLFDG